MKIINDTNLQQIYDIFDNEDYFVIITKPTDLDLTFNVCREDVVVNVYGIVSLSDDMSSSLKIKTKHMSPSARSRVEVRAVLFDNAVFNFDGMIYIEKGAQLSDAYLQNDNLIIGDSAKVNSAPQLEILADDVKASHGVTISSLDEEHMYYLMSRGIGDFASRQLVVHGFLSDVIKGIRMDELKDYNIPGLIYEEN